MQKFNLDFQKSQIRTKGRNKRNKTRMLTSALFCGYADVQLATSAADDIMIYTTRLRNRFKTASSIAQYPLSRWTVSRRRGGWRPSGCCVADLQRRADWLTGISGTARLGYPVSSIHSETVAKCSLFRLIVLHDSETRHARENLTAELGRDLLTPPSDVSRTRGLWWYREVSVSEAKLISSLICHGHIDARSSVFYQ